MSWNEANSIIINTGSVYSGAVSDTYTDNGVRHVLNEVPGPPPAGGGFDYEYVFTTIPGTVTWFRVLLNGYYEGNPAHIVEVHARNYTTGTWYFLAELPSDVGDDDYIFADLEAADFVSGGQAKVRFKHISNGSAGHYLHIDYLYLEDRSALYATTLAPTTFLTTLSATTFLTTPAPTTLAPTTLAPTTLAPTTLAPTTLAPLTAAPTTLSPTTFLTTLAPTTVPPGSGDFTLTPIHAILKHNKPGQHVAVFAWDTVALKPKVGDALNIFAKIAIDTGAAVALTDVNPVEIHPVRMPGVYRFNLTQAETDGDLIVIYPISTSANVELNPIFANTLLSAFAWVRTA